VRSAQRRSTTQSLQATALLVSPYARHSPVPCSEHHALLAGWPQKHAATTTPVSQFRKTKSEIDRGFELYCSHFLTIFFLKSNFLTI
jgi:hypothetical protein